MATIGLAALHVVQLSSYAQVSDHDIITELNSHADTTAVGTSTASVIHDYEQPFMYMRTPEKSHQMTIVMLSLPWLPMTRGHIYACLQSSNSH